MDKEDFKYVLDYINDIYARLGKSKGLQNRT